MATSEFFTDRQGTPLDYPEGVRFVYDPRTQGQAPPLDVLGSGLKQLGGGTVGLGKAAASLPMDLSSMLGLTPSMSTLTGENGPQKPKKIDKMLNENVLGKITQLVDQGVLPNDPQTFLKALGESSSEYGLVPSEQLGVLGRLVADKLPTKMFFPERQKLQARQAALLETAEAYAGVKMHAMSAMSQQQALLNQYGPKTTGEAEALGASPRPDLVPYAPGQTPLTPGQSLMAFDEAKLNLKPRPDLVSPEEIAGSAQLFSRLGNITPESAQALQDAPISLPLPRTTVQEGLKQASSRMAELEKSGKTEMRELEDPATRDKYLALVDKKTGAVVQKIGPTPRAVNDLIGEEGTRDILSASGHDPYKLALKAVNGDKASQQVIQRARLQRQQELENIKSAGERATIAAKPLDQKDRDALTLMTEFKRHIQNIKNIPTAKLQQYVGVFSMPAHEWVQIARKDPTFAQFATDLGFIQREFFSDETAGAALTPLEFNTLRKSIPQGNEWGGLTDFLAKLDEADKRIDTMTDARLKFSTETRGQSQDRLTGKAPAKKTDSAGKEALLDKLIRELEQAK